MHARQERAWWLWVNEGLSMREIGRRTGVSVRTAWLDVIAARERFQIADEQRAVLIRERQARTAERLQHRHMRNVDSPQSASIVLAAMQREARLFAIDLERKDAYTAEQVVGLLRGITQLFTEIVADERLRREFALGLRRRAGLLASGDVVAEQKPESEEEKVS